MVFSSLLFLFRFLPAILLVYYIVPHRFRNLVLLIFSLAFYAWSEPVYIILMLASIMISYTGGILVDRFKQIEKMKAAKATLIISCIASLSLLAFFKYAGFAVETVNSLTGTEITMLNIAAWMGLAAYTFQIYFDFSAYSDMAIGLGRMFGFRFLENFHYPYISKSITEFWRRWHISFGTWFREYVYIPLGGNRVSKWRHIRNILVVWLLTGIWHGASWNFLIWGVYYGVLLLAEKFVFGKYLQKLPALFQHIYCMIFVMLGWNLFVFENMEQGIEFLKSLFGFYGQGFLNTQTVYLLFNNAALLILCILGSTQLPGKFGKWLSAKLAGNEIVLAAVKNTFYIGVFLLSIAWLVDATFNPFLYFRF